MRSIKNVTVDPWSWLDLKEGMTSNRRNHPAWVGNHWRRLQAYTMYDMYYRNRGEHWIEVLKTSDIDEWREYGDPYIVTEANSGQRARARPNPGSTRRRQSRRHPQRR